MRRLLEYLTFSQLFSEFSWQSTDPDCLKGTLAGIQPPCRHREVIPKLKYGCISTPWNAASAEIQSQGMLTLVGSPWTLVLDA